CSSDLSDCVPASMVPSSGKPGERASAVTAGAPCQNSTGTHCSPPLVERITPLPSVPAKSVRSLAKRGEATRAWIYGLVKPSFAGCQVRPESVERKQPAVVPAKSSGSPPVGGEMTASTVPPQPASGVTISQRSVPPGARRPSPREERAPGKGIILSTSDAVIGSALRIDGRITLGRQHQRIGGNGHQPGTHTRIQRGAHDLERI